MLGYLEMCLILTTALQIKHCYYYYSYFIYQEIKFREVKWHILDHIESKNMNEDSRPAVSQLKDL